MKKLFYFIIILSVVTACSEGLNSPKIVVKKFMFNLTHGNLEEAKKYCTDESVKLLAMSSMFAGKNGYKELNYKILRDSIVGDQAWVFYLNNETKNENTMDLIKINDKWLVDLHIKK
ncbi:MAG TPA: hypothetical protein VK590_04595 [Saprospiraceae bacterium]|nr:hypothetical protein [Saprospiraceae bacterium]